MDTPEDERKSSGLPGAVGSRSGGGGIEEQALASVSALERALFANLILKFVRSPVSRFNRKLPEYGVRGATYLVVAGFWALPVLIGTAIGVVGQVVRLSALEAVAAALFVCGGLMGYFRIYTAGRARRRWRKGQQHTD